MTFEDTPRLSDALAMATDDIESLLPNTHVKFNMGLWLRGQRTQDQTVTHCTVCLAGSIVLKRYDGLKMLSDRLDQIPDHANPDVGPTFVAERQGKTPNSLLALKLIAVDHARAGCYRTAVSTGWPAASQNMNDQTRKKLESIPRSVLGNHESSSKELVIEGITQLRQKIIPALRALGL